MSWNNFPIMSDRPRQEKPNHSKKLCCCGGHNRTNHKANKRHHSTKTKLERRKLRRFVSINEWVNGANHD